MLHDFTGDSFDILIQAGQSNSVGGGKGETSRVFTAEDWGLEETIWYLNPDFTLSAAGERVWGNQPIGDFSLSFARAYLQSGRLAPGRKLMVIRGGEGGTGFSDHRWGVGEDLRLRLSELIKTAGALNPENRFVCFLWHQGETDAIENCDGETHFRNLLALVEEMTGLTGESGLPFLTAGFVPEWEQEKNGTTGAILAAMRQVCRTLPRARFVESAGLRSNDQAIGDGDHIHFCRDSLYELGERLFDAFAAL